MKNKEEQWHWQEPETAWKGVGIYHVTMVVSSREPLLGQLVIPDNNPENAYVDLTPLGEEIKNCVQSIPNYHSEIQILALRMMPDHVHFILHVKHTMTIGIKAAVRGFWQGAKTIGRAYTSSIAPNGIRDNERRDPIFSEMPFIRPMSRRGQLQAMIHYVQKNPQRLATKILKPGYFYVQHDVEIGGRMYEVVGNIKLLQGSRYQTVHVRSIWVKDAEEHGDDKSLRDYKNGCVLAAREGAVMVSPFISGHERAVLDVLIKEKRPIIYIADNGFGKYYKPSDAIFDAVAEGRMLILSAWPYDPKKKHVTRVECVEMNKMADDIAASSVAPNGIRNN